MISNEKILIIKHGALGDIIFSLGAFKAIRQYHKKAKLVLLTTSPFKKFAEKTGLFDEIWIDNRPSLWKWWQWWKLFRRIHQGKFDQIYDLQRSKRTRIYYKIINALFRPTPLWSGNVEGCAFPFTDPQQMIMHICDAHKAQLKIAGILSVPDPDLNWLQDDIGALKLPDPFFIMIPGCSASQAHKRWPAENFAAIALRLVKKGITPVLLGTAEEKEALDHIKAKCPKAINLMGKTTLWQIPELARHAVGALGHDTGPMHMTTIAGCPSLMLFSYSSIPARCGPRNTHSHVLKKDNLKDISVETVYKVLRFRNNTTI